MTCMHDNIRWSAERELFTTRLSDDIDEYDAAVTRVRLRIHLLACGIGLNYLGNNSNFNKWRTSK